MKKFNVLIFLLAFAVTLSSCSKKDQESPSTDSSSENAITSETNTETETENPFVSKPEEFSPAEIVPPLINGNKITIDSKNIFPKNSIQKYSLPLSKINTIYVTPPVGSSYLVVSYITVYDGQKVYCVLTPSTNSESFNHQLMRYEPATEDKTVVFESEPGVSIAPPVIINNRVFILTIDSSTGVNTIQELLSDNGEVNIIHTFETLEYEVFLKEQAGNLFFGTRKEDINEAFLFNIDSNEKVDYTEKALKYKSAAYIGTDVYYISSKEPNVILGENEDGEIIFRLETRTPISYFVANEEFVVYTDCTGNIDSLFVYNKLENECFEFKNPVIQNISFPVLYNNILSYKSFATSDIQFLQLNDFFLHAVPVTKNAAFYSSPSGLAYSVVESANKTAISSYNISEQNISE